mmetsp:Transcript_26775/g.33016  ORF Transcript_26775/g.33016 Transcript_26775/m.33016 type:complete len:81 (-) Transcript_26775:562-804(-)
MWNTSWGNACDKQVGFDSPLNGSGANRFVIAECSIPSLIDCNIIDSYGKLDVIGSGSAHDFTNGRAVRKLMSKPIPSFFF